MSDITISKAEYRRLKQQASAYRKLTSHLFESSTTRIGISRNSYIRGYVFDFIEMFAPHLDHASIQTKLEGNVEG